MFLQIKNGEIYAPAYQGAQELLLCGRQIAEMAETVDVPRHGALNVIDAEGCYVVPGFVETHAHFLGAGGLDGPCSRSFEVQISELIRGGITTAIGPLGTDNYMNTMARLLCLLENVVYAGKLGVNLDITASMSPDLPYDRNAVSPAEAISTFLDAGIAAEQITMSSDSGAGIQFRNYPGTLTDTAAMYQEFKKLVQRDGVPLESALRFITINPAERYGLAEKKGRLGVGMDADVLILNKDLSLRTVIAKGKVLYDQGAALIRGVYEESYMRALS